jgi:hypothetical protein
MHLSFSFPVRNKLRKNKGTVLTTRDNRHKTIWCRFYIDDFNTAKVKILDIRRGKYRIIDDKEGGKYIGRIVDASDVAHFEI